MWDFGLEVNFVFLIWWFSICWEVKGFVNLIEFVKVVVDGDGDVVMDLVDENGVFGLDGVENGLFKIFENCVLEFLVEVFVLFIEEIFSVFL